MAGRASRRVSAEFDRCLMVKFGFGRKYAVISSAFDSSILICPAISVGLADMNFCFTCSQVRAVWALVWPWALNAIRDIRK